MNFIIGKNLVHQGNESLQFVSMTSYQSSTSKNLVLFRVHLSLLMCLE